METAMEMHCNHCGVKIKAPPEAAGRWGNCPRCGQKVYVPSESDQVDEIPIAPLDAEEERRAKRQRIQDRQIEEHILEGGGADVPVESSASLDEGVSRQGHDPLRELLARYVRGMGTGRLADCDSIVATLVGKKKAVAAGIETIMALPLPSREFGDLPAPVVQGYLKQLLNQL
jgi:hypothetical protein